jgi:hypothetical protein
MLLSRFGITAEQFHSMDAIELEIRLDFAKRLSGLE